MNNMDDYEALLDSMAERGILTGERGTIVSIICANIISYCKYAIRLSYIIILHGMNNGAPPGEDEYVVAREEV